VLDDNSDGVHSMQLERTGPVNRRGEVLRLIAAARSALADNRKHRQLRATGLRRGLRSHRETIRTVLLMIWRRRKAAADDRLLIRATRRQEAMRAGSELPDALNDWPPLSEPLGHDCNLSEEQKVLQAIQRHREGVSIVEIGNELGVDFRRLLASTDTLLASGQIDQVQELFYPAQR
jgi:hypothetical protein